jgi:hypothetical protein
VRADTPADASTTRRPRLSAPVRCAVMKASTSALVTSSTGLSTTVKNTFRSIAVASTVFGRQRLDTKSR